MISENKYQEVSKKLGVESAVIKAIAEVESNGAGFLGNGDPVILYEPFYFSRLTKNKYPNASVIINGISYPLSVSGSWSKDKAKYGPTSIQHRKLQAATELNREAALMSCSWGKFQIMGNFYEICGRKNIQQFVNDMYESEDKHLDIFVEYIKAKGLVRYLQNKSWANFAKFYNGPSYKDNNYDLKLERAYDKWKKQG